MTASNPHSPVVRQARQDDLPALFALNKAVAGGDRLSQADIRRCLKAHAAGQWLAEAEGRVVGAVYSQRLSSLEAFENDGARASSWSHDADGPVAHLLAWAMEPTASAEVRHALLTQTLTELRSLPDVQRIVLLASCEGEVPANDGTLDAIDPWAQLGAALTIHRDLGARILRMLPALPSKSGRGQEPRALLEYIHTDRPAERSPFLFVLSAATPERLCAYASKVIVWLDRDLTEAEFRNAIYTWQTGRTAMRHRLALRVHDLAELRERLRYWLNGSLPMPGMWSSHGAADVDEVSDDDAGIATMAKAWVAGDDIVWQSLYAGIVPPPRCIAVPTYPFADVRHWYADTATTSAASQAEAAPPVREQRLTLLQLSPRWDTQPVGIAAQADGPGPPSRHVVLVCGFSDMALETAASGLRSVEWRRLPMPSADDSHAFIEMALTALECAKQVHETCDGGWALVQVLIEDRADAHAAAGLWGLLRSAVEEYREFVAQVIVSDGASVSELARQLHDETREARTGQMRYRQGVRYRHGWHPLQARSGTFRGLREGGVYCITGGLGGLGAIVAAELLRRGRGVKIVLVGRRPLVDALETRFRELASLADAHTGAELAYRAVDIADPAAVSGLIEDIVWRYGHLHGIVHAAGILDDGRISGKTPEGMRRVLVPKVLGAINLDVATRGLGLDFFALFASIFGVFGNDGQVDYAAANAFLDAFAHARNARVAAGYGQGRTVSIDWPLWQEGGMRIPADRLEVVRRETGMMPMRTASGLEVFFDSLHGGPEQRLVLEGDVNRLQVWLDRVLHPPRACAAAVRAVGTATAALREAVLRQLVRHFAEATERDAGQIDTDDPMENYGLDSIIINRLNLVLGDVLPGLSRTVFFEFRTLSALCDELLARHHDACLTWVGHAGAAAETAAKLEVGVHERRVSERRAAFHSATAKVVNPAASRTVPAAREPIAIIGLSGVYPKAPNLQTFWRNIREGRDCVEEIPAERWSLDGFYEADVNRAIEQGKSYSKWGGFVDTFADFDPLFFNISPREAMNIDPQERLFLQECWRAMESTGYTRQDLKTRFGGRVGVFAGITKTGFNLYAMHRTLDGEPFLPYTSFGSTANRVSYVLDINGPSMPVDTMCASSLTAIHEACQHILRGECDIAFAGGVNLYLHPNSYIWLSSQHMLAPDGRCRSFGAGGHGYVPGEGAGVVLLKRLSEAERDGDPIHGVILATHVNHGGRTHGYTVPNPNAQAALIRDAIDAAGIDARAISYIETHGTGTELGDPIEITGLERAFAMAPGSGFRCRIGSVKTNIGHLEAAAGIAGLTKVLLQMRHDELVPSLHSGTPNPNIDWQHSPFEVNTHLQSWSSASSNALKIAGISSFGASGTNAHVIVQEYRAPTPLARINAVGEPVLVPLSARSEQPLIHRTRDLLSYLDTAGPAVDLAALAYTLQIGREAMEHRLCFVVRTAEELVQALRAHIDGAVGPVQCHAGHLAEHREALRMFTRDEDFRLTVQRWVDRRKLDLLAEFWVRGLDVDWHALYDEHPPVRLALPTYPFVRERLWVDTRVATRSSAPPSAALHPLVHVNVSDLYRQAYASVLSGNEPCLRDHVVAGEKVLPGVAYLEMVRVAMDRALPAAGAERVLELRDAVWVQPLVVDAPRPVEVVLRPAGESGRIAFEVASSPMPSVGQSVASDASRRVHCQGEAIFVAETAPERIDLRRLQARMTRGQRDAEAVYAMFDGTGVEFGPAHRGIREVLLGEGEALAQLYLPDVVSPADPAYVLHPSLMDSALQACSSLGAAVRNESGTPLLPFALDRLRVFAPCRGDLVAWVRRVDSGRDHADAPVSFDVEMLDADGRMCAQIRGFSMRPRVGASPHTELRSYVPVWNRIAPARDQRPATKPLVVAGGGDAVLQWVRQSVPDAVALPAVLLAGEGDLSKFLRDQVDQLLWVAPDVADPSSGSEIDTASALAGLHSVFRLVKAALDLSQPPRWTFLTRQIHAVRAGDPVGPCHAGIAGFVGSLSREYPDWDIRLLDVDAINLNAHAADARDGVRAIDCVGMSSDPSQACFAHRDGEWFRRGLATLDAAPIAQGGYRQGGTYVVVGGAGGIGEAWSRDMIERYDARLVWIGRRPLDAVIAAKIEALSRLGHAPVYVSADATDLQALQRAAKRIRAAHPAIHGVVHSAIELRDQSLAQMDEADLELAVAAKMAVAVNLDRVFGDLDLDFVLFFSSMISFMTSAGQANYSAGSTFADSFAQALAQHRPYAVKIMNWGYWGGVGIVADAFHQERMRQRGIASIEVPEAMAALRTLVGHPTLSQVGTIKLLEPKALAMLEVAERVGLQRRAATSGLPVAVEAARASLVVPAADVLRRDLPSDDMDALSAELMAAALVGLGIDAADASATTGRVLPAHARWLQTSVELAKAHDRAPRAWDVLWREWDARRASWLENPRLSAQALLLEACLRELPAILTGERAATDVIFPEASMARVQGVYQGHALADCCNAAVGELLVAWLRRLPPTAPIRLFEIGAGTGGTTTGLLPRLVEFGARVEEYRYTDLSKAFLIHAERQFSAQCPALRTSIFDVSRAPVEQGIETARYDVVVATNVLHATPDMRRTLRHAKALLRPGGVVLINEMTGWSLMRHLTFGLLEGWWLYEDEALREPGSPGMSPESWRRLLTDEGFEDVAMVVPETHGFGQFVVAGSSDGLWRQRIAAPAPAALVAPAPVMHRHAIALDMPVAAELVTTMPEASLHERCASYLRRAVADTLRLDESRIGLNSPLADYGLDSILVIGLTSQLRKAFPEIRSTVFFEARDVSDLADMLLRHYPVQAEQHFGREHAAPVAARGDIRTAAQLPQKPLRLSAPSMAAPSAAEASSAMPAVTDSATVPQQGRAPFDVAIIGLSGRYPMANDMETFWSHLAQGRHCIGEIPADRWDWRECQGHGSETPDAIYTRWGGFLDRIDQFDPLFFRISPKEAKAIDPQERLFLQACYHAIEDAGYRPNGLAQPEKMGVFVGVMNARYTQQPLHYSIANRVSFALDFQGPSVAVDTACSSSLSAIHFALESLYSGSSECAIAGGVNLIIDAGHYRELTALGMLSHSDRCRAFGADADGFVDAEGVGAVVLKPLWQAERDGDLIYGVIKASAINAGGRTHGYTVPNPVAQAAVVSEALRRANVSARDVSCIEAHGTGTALGDPIEIAGLRRAFEVDTRDRGFCAIGSLKSNIGHCESAAGIAALTKVLLQLQHGQLVPTLHVEEVNPEIDFAQTPFRLQRTLQAWTRPTRIVDGQVREAPRIAGISSFGAGGANAHLLVQEYVPSVARPAHAGAHDDRTVVVPLSARTADQLAQKVVDLLAYLERARARGDTVSLASLAYTLQVGREEREERLAIVVEGIDALTAALHRASEGAAGPELFRGHLRRDGTGAAVAVPVVDDASARTPAQSARSWVEGAAIDWSLGWADPDRPARLRLPLYPFSKDSYWQPISRDTGRHPRSQQAAIHPLLHRNVSTLSATAYETVIDRTNNIASDHRLDAGTFRGRVVPAAVYLEMAHAALIQAVEGVKDTASTASVVELADTTWAVPAVFEDRLTLRASLLRRSQGAVGFEIVGPTMEHPDSVLCQGVARSLDIAEPPRLDLSALTTRTLAGHWDAEAFYRNKADAGLAYGDAYRCVIGLRPGNGEALAELRLPGDSEMLHSAFGLSPALLDGAMQAASTLLPVAMPPSLPWRLVSLRAFRVCPARVFAWVRGSSTGGIPGFDIDLCDVDGRICVQMMGLIHGALETDDTQAVPAKTAASAIAVGSAFSQPIAGANAVSASVGLATLSTPATRAKAHEPQPSHPTEAEPLATGLVVLTTPATAAMARKPQASYAQELGDTPLAAGLVVLITPATMNREQGSAAGVRRSEDGKVLLKMTDEVMRPAETPAKPSGIRLSCDD
jgi:acyl transferase domain-containing protein/SAM-dependent methyltransferase/aryl carrier-like protein